MHIKSPASLLLLIASLASAYTGDIDCQQGDEAFQALDHLGVVATAFCSSFLEQATITAATVTPTVTSTITTTSTATVRPAAVTARGLDECTFNQMFGYPCKGATKRGERPVIPGPLVQFADPLISAACSLLGVTPGATTKTVTAPPTTTTTAVATTATATVARGNCDADAAHNSSNGSGNGNVIEMIAGDSPLSCCQECQAIPNCVANAYSGGTCQILKKIAPIPGARSDLCPLGIEDYDFGPFVVGGIVFKGPCAY